MQPSNDSNNLPCTVQPEIVQFYLFLFFIFIFIYFYNSCLLSLELATRHVLQD